MVGVRVWEFALLVWCFCLIILHVSAQNTTHPNEVSALKAVRKRLVDPMKHLKSWRKGDPCVSNWTGIYCHEKVGSDGYFHIRELELLNMNLSGTLAPELGQLSHLEILDFMWNQITGSIPKEIGNLSSLKLLLLNGNNLSGSVPDELGFLSKVDRLQLDENNLSGSVPKTFSNLRAVKHLHLNNNSFSGQIPAELSQLPNLVHLLLDNNYLSGVLPPEFSPLANLEIIQLDNNQFVGAEIPESYQNLSTLVKLSLRNCSLSGAMPDFSRMPDLIYIDLSWNQFTGNIPSNKLSDQITTVILSHNRLSGSIPESFSSLPSLQLLSLQNNSLNGSVPASIWQNKSFNATARLTVDLRYNLLSDVSGNLRAPQNVTLRLRGNPLCTHANVQNIHRFCDSDAGWNGTYDVPTNSAACPINSCPPYFEYIPDTPTCFCAAPILIGYRLKSPSFIYFPPYRNAFELYITQTLHMELYQLYIDSYAWEEGPRLRMYLKLFPSISSSNHTFNTSELEWIRHIYTWWHFPGSDLFGPYELLNFTLVGPYASVNFESGKKGVSKGLLAGILVGAVICAVMASVAVTLLIVRRKNVLRRMSTKNLSSKISIKIDGVKEFTFKEMSKATSNFCSSAQVGQGGYGKVYRGVLEDSGTLVAVKRAEEGSLQGKREFLTEIELLSRLHHRNLVSLIGYSGEGGEQMLVYEFMSNGTLRDWLSGKGDRPLNFVTRLRIALGASKGILYLHTEANPPIFHRDIKASNILLDCNLVAKVADFGLSRFAPVLDEEGSLPGHVSTVVRGTPGYLDPEYFLTHKVTDKSDVYSLGVVFLEILTGVPPISHGKNLVREVNMAVQSEDKLLGIIDSKMGEYPSECAEKFTELALRCCEDKPEMRPCMLEVVRELENILRMVPESMAMSDTTSAQSHGSSTSFSTSFMSSFPKYTRTSSDVSGSDLTSTILHSTNPR